MRLVLHACWAFLINSNDDQTLSLPDTSSQTPTKNKLPPTRFCHCFFVVALLLFLHSALSILISSFFILPPPAVSFWLHLKQKTQHKTGCLQSVCRNTKPFMSCNSHCFMLSVLGWAVNCSPKRHLSIQHATAWILHGKRRGGQGFWESLFRLMYKWLNRERFVIYPALPTREGILESLLFVCVCVRDK